MFEVLEKILSRLPKPRLSSAADFRIKAKLYNLIVGQKITAYFRMAFPRNAAFRNAAVAALIVIFIFSSASLYAYQDNNLTPGQNLYSLKRAVEKVEERAAITYVSKAAVYQKFSQKRLEEAYYLSQEHLPASANKQRISDYIKNNLDEAINNINSAQTAAQKIKDVKAAESFKSKAKEKEKQEGYYLDEIEKGAQSSGDNELIKKINQARSIIVRRADEQGVSEEADKNNELKAVDPASARPVKRQLLPAKSYQKNIAPEEKVESVKIINSEQNMGEAESSWPEASAATSTEIQIDNHNADQSGGESANKNTKIQDEQQPSQEQPAEGLSPDQSQEAGNSQTPATDSADANSYNKDGEKINGDYQTNTGETNYDHQDSELSR